MELSSAIVLQLAMLSVGGASVVWYAYEVFRGRLNSGPLGDVLEKLLREKKLPLALRLSRTAEYPVLRAVRSVLVALERGRFAIEAESPTCRDAAAVRSPDVVLATLRATYNAAFEEAARCWRTRRQTAIGGLVLLGVAIALIGVSRGPTSWLTAGCGCMLLFVPTFRQECLQRADALTMFERLAQVFSDAAMDPAHASDDDDDDDDE